MPDLSAVIFLNNVVEDDWQAESERMVPASKMNR
jgi:hypothetical protein